MRQWRIVLRLAVVAVIVPCQGAGPCRAAAEAGPLGTDPGISSSDPGDRTEEKKKIVKTDAQWRRQLSRLQYRVTRLGVTERAFTGRYYRHRVKGVYKCVCCDEPLFHSSTKYKSGTGWPSFYAPIDDEQIDRALDRRNFVIRMEVVCRRCDAHLGHVFPDGPAPTGLRYCINSAALKFTADPTAQKAGSDGDRRTSR